MPSKNINSVISVIPVKNFELALEWYQKLFEREPDLVPMEGIAEWQLLENAWIQVSIDLERAGSTTVVIVVNDLESKCKVILDANLPIGEIVEYPEVIKMAEIIDKEGNKISFVQDISNDPSN
ncbi:MAG: hypothetical protein COA66_01280 [Arcobacter sp.]|nr:MAG: hypothetical protein COA66_01280 [Arcobacter sp.]